MLAARTRTPTPGGAGGSGTSVEPDGEHVLTG
jgi:hypothetical protein